MTRDNLQPSLSHSRMPRFKKSNKPRRPSQQPKSLGILTHVATGLLGPGTALDLDANLEGVLHSTAI